MNSRTKMTTIVWALVPGVALALPPAQPTPETVAFLDNHPGVKAALRGDGIGAVFGASLASRGAEASTRLFVESFLQGNVDILGARGVTGDDLTYDNDLLISNGKFRVFTYNQTVFEEDGLPMHGGFIKVVLLLGATEKIVHIGSTLKHEPVGDLPNGTETAQNAIDTVDNSPEYGHLTIFSTPEEVIYNPGVEVYHRAWRFTGSDDDEHYLFFVDTTTGDIVDAIDIRLDGDISGRAEGFGTPGTGADEPGNPPVKMNLPGIEVTAVGFPSVHATEDGSGDDGTYTIQNVSGTVDVSSVLDSQWVTVVSDPGSSFSHLSDTVFGVTSPASGVDLLFNDAATPDPEETSQVNAFLAINKSHNWFKTLQENFTEIDQQILCTVNKPQGPQLPPGWRCNAWYNPGSVPPKITSAIPVPNDDICNSSAFSSIMAHEVGHFILDKFLPGMAGATGGSFHEGFGDTVASLVYDTHCLGENCYKPAHPRYDGDPPLETCARRIDAVAANHFFKDFSEARCSPIGGCEVLLNDSRCSSEIHCLGVALAGAFWDLRTAIGDAATERIFADFAACTCGVLDQRVIVEVLTADDDDGDLNTLSTHQLAITDAFEIHGWEDPTDSLGVVVEWSGPVAPYTIPVEGTDYTLNLAMFPPTVKLITTFKGGQPVTEWRLGRLLGGTETGDPGSVTAAWSGTAQNIRVRVGTTAATPCRNLHGIDIEAQSTAKYSNLQLVLEGNLVGTARCEPAGNDGGLIEGSMVDAETISARGIGSGTNAPGDLVVSGQLTTAMLETIPTGSKLEVGRLGGGGATVLSGELDGTLQIDTAFDHAVTIEGTATSMGTIDARTDLNATIDIAGAMSGDILVQGDINAVISIGGAFTGNICANNLVAGDVNGNLNFEFGIGARVCDWEVTCGGQCHS